MRLLSLDVRDFRNLARVTLELSPRATVLVGRNGQEKTNLLESIFFLTTLKPLHGVRLAELVRFGAPSARVEGSFDGPGGARRVAVEVEPGARTAFLDGKPQDRLDDYFEGLVCIRRPPCRPLRSSRSMRSRSSTLWCLPQKSRQLATRAPASASRRWG